MSSILIIGESCQDEFVYCNAERLAPDLPIPILKVVEVKKNPGMAMNVLRNVSQYVKKSEIYTNPNWEQVTKTRYVDVNTNHSFIRIDSPDEIEPYKHSKISKDFDLVLISDYNKGFLTEDVIAEITSSHPNVFLDTKKILGDWAAKAKYIKINDYEFQRSLPYLDEAMLKKIIHTQGSNGSNFQGKNYPVELVQVRDSSGAGDSFFAALAIKFLESKDIEKSIIFANKAATKVVSEKGVTVI
jgi:D-beta-D-heptose 7-phosphate kinase/D-beta-D-heptose 1-phosphate adenosyltransferase